MSTTKFERNGKTEKWNFLASEQKGGENFSDRGIALQNALPENERENNFNDALFCFGIFFSSATRTENCSAQFSSRSTGLFHVDFKVHCLRDGLSVKQCPACSANRPPAFIGHNLDKIGDGKRFL